MQKFPDIISSKQNPLIKEIKALSRRKNRDLSGRYFFEGWKLAQEAIAAQIPIDHILVSQSWLQKNVALTAASSLEHTIVADAVMTHLSSQMHPEGILCVARKREAKEGSYHKYILLDGMSDPGNMGAIIRTADAAGFDIVVCLDNCVDIYNEKTLRASMGSCFHLPIKMDRSAEIVIDELKENKIPIIGASLQGKTSLKPPQASEGLSKFALILGSESHGIRPEIEARCDSLWKLPILGKAESLNVAVAAGIMMYACQSYFCDEEVCTAN
ncbi:RNA methyltransferase [Pseudoramibacter faecis]|uniref:TrmH family RNA methyltransferase n=1 Tax=Pseudoramibacter faecis TaxID=3108534 RepID=UPI002E767CC2|nr:RNA methyltransferase [Pseudoramibacter sp. HA2172]